MLKKLLQNENYVLLALVVIASLLTLPSLFNGLVLDDYFHRLLMLNISNAEVLEHQGMLWGLFSFLQGNSEQTTLLVNQGVLPWWTFPEIKYTFFRPLSELSIALDYQLWPESPVAMHLQNTFWFALSVWGLGLFLFYTSPKKIAFLALIFFIFEGSHGFAISWLASRNAIIAFAMSIFALYFIARFLHEKGYKFYFFALLFHIFALSAGEIGITSAAFLCLYLLIFSTELLAKRIFLCILPVLITLCWLGLRAYLGYGVQGTGAYIDPFHMPEAFFFSVIDQIGLVFFALSTGLPVEVLIQLSRVNTFFSDQFYLITSIFLLAILFPIFFKNKRAYFYLLAGLAAIIPVLAGELQSRVLFLASFPVLCFVAECLIGFQERQQAESANFFKKWLLSGSWTFLMYFLALMALLSHLVIAPLLLVYSQGLIAQALGNGLYAAAEHSALNDEDEGKTLVLLNPPNASAAGYLAIMAKVNGSMRTNRTYILSSGAHGVEILRKTDSSLEIVPTMGFLADPMDRVMRSDSYSLTEGESFLFDDLIVNISELNSKNRPSRASFRFSENLDTDRYLFKCWQGSGESARLIDCKLPEIGHKMYLEPVRF
jgi:hypothetical protein